MESKNEEKIITLLEDILSELKKTDSDKISSDLAIYLENITFGL